MGLDIKTYEPPSVATSDDLLKFNLFLSIHFKVKDIHSGEIKNLFVANFVSFLIFIFFMLMSLIIHVLYSISALGVHFQYPCKDDKLPI